MGTVVFPDADVKVFLIASIEERARRRRAQLLAQGVDQPLDELIADIAARDAYDSGRALAPLRKADDAVEIDTTGMTIPEVIEAVCALVAEASSADGPAAPAPALAGSRRLIREPPRSGRCQPHGPRPSRHLALPLRLLVHPAAVAAAVPHEDQGRGEHPAARGRCSWRPITARTSTRSSSGVAFPRQIHFMAKAELWKFKPLGRLIDMLGPFPVNRGEADRDGGQAGSRDAWRRGGRGDVPEGHRQRSGQLGEIHPGVSLFSLREGVVTIPMILDGTERVVRKGLPRFPGSR